MDNGNQEAATLLIRGQFFKEVTEKKACLATHFEKKINKIMKYKWILYLTKYDYNSNYALSPRTNKEPIQCWLGICATDFLTKL